MKNLTKVARRQYHQLVLSPEPLWDFRYYVKAHYIQYHVPNTGDRRHVTLSERDVYQSQGVYSFTSKDFRLPIDELLMVRFPGRLVSLVSYARAGVIDQIKTATQNANVGPLRVIHEHMGDRRKRIALSIEAENPAEVERMQRWIQCLDNLSPFTSTMHSIMRTVLTEDDATVNSTLKFEVSKDKRPLYMSLPEHIYYWGECARFNKYTDAVIRSECPPMIEAILESRADIVKALLEKDPASAMSCDPWGQEPTDLARRTGQGEIFEMLVEKRRQFVHRGCPGQHNFQQMIKTKEARAAQQKRAQENGSQKEPTEDPFAKARAEYEKLKQGPIPTRTRLQEACIHGDLAVVQSEVQKGALIEEFDPLCFKPLFLAVANDHYEIAKWLLEQGASIDRYHEGHPARGYRGFFLVDQVKSPKMMRLVLYYHAGMEVALRRLMEFLEDNDHAMVEVLLYYLRNVNTKEKGISPFDYAIEHTKGETQRQLVELFSQYWEDYLPKGPYDASIPQEIRDLLTQHNERIDRREFARLSRPRIRKVLTEPEQIRTILSVANGDPITLDSKRVSQLTKSEIDAITALFHKTFSMRENDSEERRNQFFSHYIDQPHDDAYVDVCRQNGEIISFLFYEFLNANTPTQDFRVFHTQIGATEKAYQDMGLANLAFRSAVATWSPSHPIFVFGKCIKPGLGFPLYPKNFKGLPSHQVPDDILSHVLGLVGEKRNSDKSITANLTVNTNRIPKSYKHNRFRYFAGKSPEASAPVAFFFTEDTVAEYRNAMKANNVTSENLEAYRQNWLSVGIAGKT